MSEKDLDTTIKISVDADGVEAGTTRVKRSLQDVGKVASDLGKKTSDSIGGGSDQAAKATEAAARRISNEFRRLQVDAEAMGKSLSEKMVIKANAYGVPLDAIRPQLEAIKQFEAAQRAANPGLTELAKRAEAAGTSVKGLSASMRNVPAQFTDIIISLQGGQAPLTVLLQQGGQLKDMFGSIGGATRALGGYVLSLINPFTLAAGAVALLSTAYLKGAAEGEAYNKALILTGNIAGTTAGHLATMAQNVAKTTGGTVSAAAGALAALAGSSGIASAQFEKIAAVAVGMEKTTGVAVAETVKQFAELGKDPLQASRRLNESTNFLTQSVYEQIKALMDQGKTLEAGVVAQNAFYNVSKERIPALVENLGYVERAWKKVMGAINGAGSAVASIGRQDTIADKLAAVAKEIEKGRAPLDLSGFGAGNAEARAKLKSNLELQASLQEMARLEKRGSEAAGERARIQALGISATDAVTKANERAFTKQEQMNKALREYRLEIDRVRAANPSSPLLDPKQIAKAEAGIRKQFTESAKSSGKQGDPFASERAAMKEWAQAMEQADAAYSKATAKADGLSESERKLRDYLASSAAAISEKLIPGTNELVAARFRSAIAAEKESVAAKAMEEAQKAIAKARTDAIQSHGKEIESLRDKAQRLEDEVAMYGMSKAAIEELTVARMLDRIEVLRGFEGSADEIKRIEELIDARRRLAIAGTALDNKKAGEKASDKLKEEFQKSAESLHNDVKNALSSAFRDSKDPMQAFGDALGNIIFTRVSNSMADALATQLVGNGSAGSSGLLTTLFSMFGFAKGGTFGTGVTPFARGGAFHNSVITQSTPFKFASGGSFKQAVAGEAGPEAVMPLARGADGKLGVRNLAKDGPGREAKQGDTFVININATVGDIASKTDVVTGMRTVAAQIQSTIVRSKTRGGALA